MKDLSRGIEMMDLVRIRVPRSSRVYFVQGATQSVNQISQDPRGIEDTCISSQVTVAHDLGSNNKMVHDLMQQQLWFGAPPRCCQVLLSQEVGC